MIGGIDGLRVWDYGTEPFVSRSVVQIQLVASESHLLSRGCFFPNLFLVDRCLCDKISGGSGLGEPQAPYSCSKGVKFHPPSGVKAPLTRA